MASPTRRTRIIRADRGYREGYPPYFLGTGKATKTLVEIAALEPVHVGDLPEYRMTSTFALQPTVRRLVAQGLIRRYAYSGHRDDNYPRIYLVLNRDLPIASELRALLCAIGLSRGTVVPAALPTLPSSGPKDCDVSFDYTRLFGAQARTLAIILVTLVGSVDLRTIARIVNVDVGGSSLSLLDPLETARILKRRRIGLMQLYSLVQTPWSNDFKALCLRLAECYPELKVLANAAELLRDSGDSPPRKFLRKHNL
jgi:hypothetical protein